MDTLDFDHTVFTAQQQKADEGLAVRIYVAALKDEPASVTAGRPIFADTEMIEIRVRGDRNNVVNRPVREDDKRRFRAAYDDFKAGREKSSVGTPLAEWPIMSVSMTEEMKYLGFYTVEQLADAGEAALAKVPGLLTMKNRAKAFLEFAKGAAPLEQLQTDVDQMKSQLEVQARQAEEQRLVFAELQRKYNTLLEKVAEEA